MPEIDPLILQIRAEATQARRAAIGLGDDFKRSLSGIEVNIQRMADAFEKGGERVVRVARRTSATANDNVRSLNAIRYAGIGAGQQLQDMAVQFQAGTNASTIFAQQVPQLAFALSGLEGNTNKTADKIGKFATLLSGPWGLAINLAVVAGGALINWFNSAGDASEKNAGKLDTFTAALKRLRTEQADDGGLAAAQQRLNELRDQRLNPDVRRARGESPDAYKRRVKERVDAINLEIAWLQVDIEQYQKLAAARDNASASPGVATGGRRGTRTSSGSDTQQQRDALASRITTLQQEIVLQRMVANGQEQIAARLAARWELERQFPGASKEQLSAARELVDTLIDQRFQTERIEESRANILKALKDAAIFSPDKDGIEALANSIAAASNVIVGQAIPSTKELEDALARVRDRGIDAVADGFADAIMGAEDLGDAFSRVADQIIADLIRIAIKRSIVEPLGNFLFPGGGGGLFGGLFGAIGGLFGGNRAGGGPVQAGRVYRINENATASQPEYFRPSQSGTIIPLGQVNQTLAPQPSTAGGVVRVELILSEDLNERITGISSQVAVEVVRVAGPGIANAGAAQAVRTMTRPRI